MNRCVVVVVLALLGCGWPGVSDGAQPAPDAAALPATAPTSAPASTAPSDPSVNSICPVMPDEAAVPEYELLYRGVRVRFCCNSCRTRFDQTPEPFLATLPHVPAQPSAQHARSHSVSLREKLSKLVLQDSVPFSEQWRNVLFVLLGVLMVNLAAARIIRRRTASTALDATTTSAGAGGAARRRRPNRVLQILARPSTALLLVAGVVVGRVLGPAPAPPADAGAAGSTSADMPPEIKFQSRLARQAALHGESFVKGFEKTYYRGNDDRSDKLYQGGIYRTCEFNIRLQTKEGQPVRPGDAVAGKRLFVRVEIVRAPNTLESHFSDSEMTKTFLTSREALPSMPRGNSQTAYPFVTLEPTKRWAAECDIGEIPPGTGSRQVTGMVLLCPGYAGPTNLSEAWKSAHYGIQYELRLDGDTGVVSPDSKFWMGATFFTSEFPDDRFYEWFSSHPLPTIPDGFRHESELD